MYHAVSQANFAGMALTDNIANLPFIIFKNGFVDLSTNSAVSDLFSYVSEYTRILQEFRQVNVSEFPIIFRIIHRDYFSQLSQDVLRILCRWIYDDGASSIILSNVPYCMSSSSIGLLTITDALAKELHLPIYCETRERIQFIRLSSYIRSCFHVP